MDDEFRSTDDQLDQSGDLAPLNIIRTETVFSRLPVHNLTKNGRVDIQIIRKNETGVSGVNYFSLSTTTIFPY